MPIICRLCRFVCVKAPAPAKKRTGFCQMRKSRSQIPERRSSAFRRRFNSLLKQAHVEHCGLHTLRHTFASKLFAATNGNAKLVSELVRHSSVSFTEDIYIHLIEQTKANVLEDFSI